MTSISRATSVFRKNLFQGKTAIVTGGGTGIGKGITQELLYLGCKVMIASRKIDKLKSAADEIKRSFDFESENLQFVECNIRKEDQVKNMMQTTIERFGKIDFLVNNSGGQFYSPASNINSKGFNAVIETNLVGTFYCCKAAYDLYMKENGGCIVNIIANMFNGWPGMSHSGAARAGVDNLTKSLAVEWAPNGIRINSVAPGSSIFSDTAAANYGSSEIFDNQIPRIPAKRLGTVEEVSGVVCYLLSPAASFITGETVRIDGGQSLYSTSILWEVPG
ncbi:DgyrCDS10264 [Dimorphilus gyrociliatus]|uniref:Peroxisomal trans-2-enoyl-CoA reductase n=1 Tax=Dimorphilus gyrociliatus TaxID=2664684 RepID=A0A7I8VZM3_9ANNE|nr:DgyrCDS10264 [Dimorphilus gyrociliatus]